jgi:hypothetical protein
MQGLKEIGSLVMWSLAGSHRQYAVQQAAAASGLTDRLQLPRILANNAYRRAVRTVASAGGTSVDDRGVVVKIVEDSPAQIVHQFLLGTVADTAASALTVRGAEFGHLCCIKFDKLRYAAGEPPERLVEIEDVPPGLGRDLAEAVLAEYHRTAVDVHYTHGDLRGALTRALREHMAGIQVLDHGGLWFVPAAYAGTLASVQAFIQELEGCRLVALPQYDRQAVLDEISARSKDALNGQLADLIGELERFSSSETSKLSTLEARVEAFDALRGRVDCYERLLGNTMTEMVEKLDAAQASLMATVATRKG